MLSNEAIDTARSANKKLINKFEKDLGFVPVFAPETYNEDALGMGDVINRDNRLNDIRKNLADAFSFKLINPTELNLPSDVESFSAISNFNPNVFEQLVAQKTLQRGYDGQTIQAINKDISDSIKFLETFKKEEQEASDAVLAYDPEGKELARRLSLISGDIGNADPQQVKDLIKAINAGRIKFRTPAFGESSSADRFSYRNLIHYAIPFFTVTLIL